MKQLFWLLSVSKDFIYLLFILTGVKFIAFDLSYYLINSAGITTVFIGTVIGFFIGGYIIENTITQLGHYILNKENKG
jgi:hypothetical protein